MSLQDREVQVTRHCTVIACDAPDCDTIDDGWEERGIRIGWFAVSQGQFSPATTTIHFCSLGCLSKWANSMLNDAKAAEEQQRARAKGLEYLWKTTTDR